MALLVALCLTLFIYIFYDIVMKRQVNVNISSTSDHLSELLAGENHVLVLYPLEQVHNRMLQEMVAS